MDSKLAIEQLQVIRTLMERSTLYRRALAPVMIFCGVVGIGGGVVGWQLQINSERSFVLFWSGVAVLALAGAFIMVRRQALKDSEPFWSPPTKRVTQALIPAFSIGAFIAALTAMGNGSADFNLMLISVWCWTFGCALHSAAFFMPRGMKLFGWLFIFIGCVLAILLLNQKVIPLLASSSHMLMGGIFGGLHLSYGIYLYFTEKRGNKS